MDKRSEIYFFKFDVDKTNHDITAQGIQFVTQVIKAPNDNIEFNTLKKADDHGLIYDLEKCFPEFQIVKEIAALPDKVSREDLLEKIKDWRIRSKQLIK